jgi:omega-6 fatty acid desaturase (delta-12 desaturase)
MATHDPAAANDIRRYLKDFTRKDNRIAALSYFGTYAVFFPSIWIAASLVTAGYWLAAGPFMLLITFCVARLYVVQHDFGHHSLFKEKWQNDWAGYLSSVFTFTPYRTMQYNHNMHHAYLGNLEHRETTEIFTMTRAEWDAADWKKRLWYRLYRHPLILIPVGGLFTYFIAYRWPKNTTKIGVAGVLAHNAAMLGFWALLYAALGWAGLAVFGIAVVIAANMGVFMVFLQHNFEDTYWERKPNLDYRMATLQGSSCLDLGHWWDVGTCNIAYHDIHHFMPSIPSYRLRKAHHGLPEHLALRRIGWPEALASFRLKLWDEERKCLTPFPKRAESAAAVPAE